MTQQSASAVAAAGVVLAGGASRRMGHDKALLEFGGEPLVRRVVGRVKVAVPRVVVVGPVALRAVVPGVLVMPDRAPRLGPLGGLAAALAAVDTRWIFVVGCDMPFVVPALVRAMLEAACASPEGQVIALRSAHGIEPLHAVYARSCARTVAEQLASGDHSLAGLLTRLAVREFPTQVAAALDPRGLSTFNANTPAEWERALHLLHGEPARPRGLV